MSWSEQSLATMYSVHASITHAKKLTNKHDSYNREIEAIEKVVLEKHGADELECMKKHSFSNASVFYSTPGGH